MARNEETVIHGRKEHINVHIEQYMIHKGHMIHTTVHGVRMCKQAEAFDITAIMVRI